MAEQEKIIIDVELKSSGAEHAADRLQEELKKLRTEGKQNSVEFTAVNNQFKESKKQLDLLGKAVTADANTLQGLRLKVADLRNEFNKEPIGTKRFVELQKEIVKTQTKVNDIEKSTLNFKNNVGNYGQSIVNSFGKVTLALGAIGGVLAFFNKSLDKYDKQIAAQKSLEVALDDTSQALLEQASALQQVTRFGDEEIIQGQAFLAQLGATEEQIKKLTPAVVDFAAAKQKDLAESFNLVGKAVYSSSNALKKQGVDIEGSVGSQKRLDSAVSALTSKFHDQAVEIGKVGTGPLKQMKNNLGDLAEGVGELLSKGMNPFVNALSKTFEGINKISKGEKLSGTPWYKDFKASMLEIGDILLAGPLRRGISNLIFGDNSKEKDKIVKNFGEIKEVVVTGFAPTQKKFTEQLEDLKNELSETARGSDRYKEIVKDIKSTQDELAKFDDPFKQVKKEKDFFEELMKETRLNQEAQKKLFKGTQEEKLKLQIEYAQKTESEYKREYADLSGIDEREFDRELAMLEAQQVLKRDNKVAWLQAEKEIEALYFQDAITQIGLTQSQIELMTADFNARQQAIQDEVVAAQTERAQIVVQAFQSIFTSLYELSQGQALFAGFAKSLALFEIALNTAQAIAAAIKSAFQSPEPVPFLVKIGYVATGIATVLANMASAKKIVDSVEPPSAPALKKPNEKKEKKARGGIVEGSGGIDSIPIYATAGEAVINRTSTMAFRNVLSDINQAGGGVSFADNVGKRYFQTGGIVAQPSITTIDSNVSLMNELNRLMLSLPNPVVFVEDINTGQARVARVASRANF